MRAHLPFSPEEAAWREHHLLLPHRPELWTPQIVQSLLFQPKTLHPVTYALHFEDKSSYQTAGDWTVGGRKIGVAKVSEGTTYFDRNWFANRQAAVDEDLIAFGGYMFARPSSSSADAAMIQYMKGFPGGPRPNEFFICDYEVPPWNQGFASRCADIAHSEGFKIAWFYSFQGMIAANPTDQIAQHFEHPWIAAYSLSQPGPDRWAVLGAWQHTDGAYGYIDSPTDCSALVLTSSVDAARAYFTRGGTPIPTPAPQPAMPLDLLLMENT